MAIAPHPPDDYADRLARLETMWWKRLLDVQRPYRWYLRRLELGFVLDVGCGVGRSLANAGGHGVGVDLSPRAVELCRLRGLEAYVPRDFLASRHARPHLFDSLLLAHVVEHMTFSQARELLAAYLPFVKPAGRVVLIAPQVAGFASDATHVEYFDIPKLLRLCAAAGVPVEGHRSFPFPSAVGRIFPHNEFVVIGRAPHPSR
ncbi:MAG: methyltransferase domain-containing protein [Myxococcales bacterium]|nr:methyltransferase domain-containing protein [Myxococcales bacterium]